MADKTMAFYFEKPAGFDFLAGQSIDLTLVNPPYTDTEGNTRAFSIASHPTATELLIVTRLRDSAFKKTLAEMAPETEVQIEGPFGTFALHSESEVPTVFIAGGIGITPFKSIIADAVHKKLPHSVHLFFSNRRPQDAAFLDEFQQLENKQLEKQSGAFHFIPTMTAKDNSALTDWKGERGYITFDMLKKYLDDSALSRAIFYIAGPLEMTAEMRRMLREHGIAEERIKMEEFAGY